MIPPVPFFFLKIALAIQGFLHFHTNCEIICSSSVKNTIGSLIGIALNLQIALGSILILISNTIHKTKLKMDSRSKCKTRNYKTPRGEHRQNTV